jgi:hypothetical protein
MLDFGTASVVQDEEHGIASVVEQGIWNIEVPTVYLLLLVPGTLQTLHRIYIHTRPGSYHMNSVKRASRVVAYLARTSRHRV